MAENGGDVKIEPKQEPDASDAVPDTTTAPKTDNTENEVYKLALSKKLNTDVANELVNLFEDLQLTLEDFDERAIDTLSNYQSEQAKFILKELKNTGFYGVQNRPQFIMSVMRNFKDRLRQSNSSADALKNPLIPGPTVDSIKSIIDRTNYKLEVTVGQRKYHSPPDYDDEVTHGHEVFIGQIPKDIYEEAIIPIFEEVGKIYNLRLMLDPVQGRNRGYAFLVYCDQSHAAEAAKKYDGYEIVPGKQLKVNVSVANRRLFVGNIPKSKSKEEILEELKKQPEMEGIADVIIYSFPDAGDNKKNRGFCFVDFTDHKSASDARRRLINGKVRPWNNDLVVDWAEQQAEPDEETMSQVKVLYVKNLKENVTEEQLNEIFKAHGELDKVKKIKDYAFIHFKERDDAVKALEATKDLKIDDVDVEISLAKPQNDIKQKKKTPIPQKRGGNFGRNSGGGGGGGNRGPGGNRGNGGGGQYGRYPAYPPQSGYGAPAGYDPYFGGSVGGYYGAPAAAPGGYDPYYDPYYAQGYPQGYPAGGYGGGPSRQGGPKGPPRGGRGNVGGQKRGRGAKRPGGNFDGPASKRGGRGNEDFSSDVIPNTF